MPQMANALRTPARAHAITQVYVCKLPAGQAASPTNDPLIRTDFELTMGQFWFRDTVARRSLRVPDALMG